jgi:NADH-quinone oxidoreductase subunit L
VVFFGTDHHELSAQEHKDSHGAVVENTSPAMFFPLLILALLSLFGGLITVPLDSVFAHSAGQEEAHASQFLHTLMILIPILGVMISWFLYGSLPYEKAGAHLRKQLMRSAIGGGLNRFWFSGWGMDALYQILFVRPFLALAHVNRKDIIDVIFNTVTLVARFANSALVLTQTGNLRWYAISLVAGLVLVIGLGVWR